jgi:hypothetical protein
MISGNTKQINSEMCGRIQKTKFQKLKQINMYMNQTTYSYLKVWNGIGTSNN